jgi:hypothetical protein
LLRLVPDQEALADAEGGSNAGESDVVAVPTWFLLSAGCQWPTMKQLQRMVFRSHGVQSVYCSTMHPPLWQFAMPSMRTIPVVRLLPPWEDQL